MKSQTEYKLVCSKCGEELYAKLKSEYSRVWAGHDVGHTLDIEIVVNPCHVCLDEAREEAGKEDDE